jgi:hypothetical protein
MPAFLTGFDHEVSEKGVIISHGTYWLIWISGIDA